MTRAGVLELLEDDGDSQVARLAGREHRVRDAELFAPEAVEVVAARVRTIMLDGNHQ